MTDYQKLCKKDCYNFISPYGLGDTLMLCGFHKAWEEKNKGKIHFIIQPSHEIVMKMYGIKNYTLLKFERKWFKEEFLTLGKQHPIPQIGKPYVAHPEFIENKKNILKKFNELNMNFIELYRHFLELQKGVNFEKPIYYPKMKQKFKNKIEKIAPLEKIVLFCPEAKSIKQLPKFFWENLAKEIRKKGMFIISNVNNTEEQIPETYDISMSLEEVISLALSCNHVYSLRSGLCDLIFKKGMNLTIYYDSENTKKLYSLNDIFYNKKNIIKEKVINIDIKQNSYYPSVSIVTPVFNLIQNERKQTFIENLKSVNSQTYPNIEHIIIDGASTDGTINLLKKYAQKGWIRYFSEKDSGIYDAMNKGIEKAKGKYIAFLNSDDFYHNLSAIAESVKRLEETNSDFSFGTVKMLDEKNNKILMFYPLERLVLNSMPFSHQSMFCKKSVLLKEKFDTQFKLAADYDLILRLYLQQRKAVQVDAEIATYRMNGISGKNHEKCVLDYIKVYEKNYSKYVSKKHFENMIRKNIIPKKITNLFKKKYPRFWGISQEKISFCGIPLYSVIKADNEKIIKLFFSIPLIGISQKNKVYRIRLFNKINLFKINKKV